MASANQSEDRIIPTLWGVCMSPIRLFWKSNGRLVSRRAAMVCVASLGFLLARGTPSSFRQVAAGVSARSVAGQMHKQCFDHDDFQWLSPPRASLIAPLPAEASAFVVAAAPHADIVTDGWHYNRPPPAS